MESSCAKSSFNAASREIGLVIFFFALILVAVVITYSVNSADLSTIGYHGDKVVLEEKTYALLLHTNSTSIKIRDCVADKDAIYLVSYGEQKQGGIVSCSGDSNLSIPTGVDTSTIVVQELIRGASETHNT